MIQSRTLSAKATDIGIMLLLIVIGLSCLAPILHTLAVSLSSAGSAAAGFVTFWPREATFGAYRTIMEDEKFFLAFLVSLKRVAIGTALGFVLTVMTAFPLSREKREFRIRNVYMWFFVFTMMFNGGLIPWYMTIRDLNLIDSIWALVLPGAVSVFNIILVMNYYKSIPKELDESASMDGAGAWYMLLRIYLPLSIPVLATVTLFMVIGHWNSFFDGLILMNRTENYPLQTYVQQLVVQIDPNKLTSDQLDLIQKVSNRTLSAAKIFVTMIPILVLYPFLQKYFITGIMLGSVKE